MAQALPPCFSDPRQFLDGQISALASAAQHCSLVQLVQSVDAIRSLAGAEGLSEVAMLASRLESAIAERGRSAVILSYLDAMAQAVHVPGDMAGGSSDDAWLASVAVRFAN